METIYFALFSWGQNREEKQGWQSLSMSEASGYSMFLTVLALMLVFEAIPTHILLRQWSTRLAWVCTGLTAYGLIWVVSVLRSLYLRPTLISSDTLLLRLGLLWQIKIQADRILACRRIVTSDRKGPGSLSLVKLNEPQWRITLREPLWARGPYGFRRRVSEIEFAMDDAHQFEDAVRNLLGERFSNKA